ncbi:hypothetical protein TNCV_814211 [Trichonephila clavipes]|nr:hypothetical protein TNCV_814211 [Trichonephila clavipes]
MNETTQLVSRNETTQLCTAVDRLQPPATTYNCLQPPATAYNHLQPPTTACNRLQPPTTTCNHLQPPATAYNHLQPPATACTAFTAESAFSTYSYSCCKDVVSFINFTLSRSKFIIAPRKTFLFL